MVLAINDKVGPYCQELLRELQRRDLRASLDERNETIGRKIREAEMQKIPYLLVIGPREQQSKTVAVRERGKGDRGAMKIEAFLNFIKNTAYPKQP